ncbi:hypothetical protein LTR10_016927 [Elasticomyces elasticus]|uniref:Thiamine-triphosphatase n=1 Tax=Exophiala sideris TaxID=1016849 RepID=A0ABR0JEU0_9EURO|nr:hypothetical protein LTR10_016927 [Elasticomyces elasticus]KAK5025181.1 hypothetical protein LTS07_008032 [Exophiala sideris]KAK5029272.1 hypothetical protein LTR13_008809 [Exophiala sideris]KAK5063240.1 hypothetical protein LTR69_003946 [Exophiala sideris]KAK5178956.1 hypothetical protein LTR44_008445 [Eurotiomycetes sp. CCFEE 6388]
MLLEVERKFCPIAGALIACNAGSPPFRRFCPRPQRIFRDIYYDQDDVLRQAGIWVRKRDEQWEAKIKVGGDYKHSQFQEVKGISAVSAAISKHLQDLRCRGAMRYQNRSAPFDTYNINPVAEYATIRDSWTVDDKYTIVIDTTDFGHTVGEVELEHDYPDFSQEDKKNVLLKQMDENIASFMRHYAWAFPAGECKGKLTAFFEWKMRKVRAIKRG